MNEPLIIQMQAHKTPEFRESKRYRWVEYGSFKGEHAKLTNLYPDYLLDLFNRSAKHNAIVSSKADYIAGNGVSEPMEANRFEDMDTLAKKIALDLEIFGGFALAVKKNPAGGVAEIYHKDFSKIRVGKGKVRRYFYSPDWSKRDPSREKGWKEYQPFSKAAGDTSMYYFKEYRPAMDAYPLPGYIGAVPYCEIDYEIANFHLSNIKNGFWGSFMINFLNGNPTPEEKDEIEERIKGKFSGSDNAGRFILNFADGKERAAELLALNPANMDKLFIELGKTVQQEIFTGHQVTSPMLFGVRTEGQLGGRTEILEAYELFKETYVGPKQRKIEKVLRDILGRDIRLNEMAPMKQSIANPVMRELNKLNPLLGATALDMMGPEKQAAAKKMTFKDEKDVIALFASYGVPKKNYEILQSRVMFGSEQEVLVEFLSSKQKEVLKVLKDSPNLEPSEVAKAVGITEKDAKVIIRGLKRSGYLTGEGVSEEGDDILADDPVSFQILYSYEWRKPYGPQDIRTSRDFCKQLLALDRLYSRSEIDLISAATGRNVWEMRGGWYTRPGTDTHLPYCRHIWKQNIVTLA